LGISHPAISIPSIHIFKAGFEKMAALAIATCKTLGVSVMKGRQLEKMQGVKPTECRLFARREKSHKIKAASK
jgi:hypothetical protein